MRNLKKRIKVLEILLGITLIISSMSFTWTILSVWDNYKLNNLERFASMNQPEFHFINLSEKQIRKIEYFIINNTKRDYLSKTQKIYFTGNRLACEKFYDSKADFDNCNGFQVIKTDLPTGIILIEWSPNMSAMMQTTCHELAHSFFISNGPEFTDSGHRIVNEIGDSLICFKNEFRGYF